MDYKKYKKLAEKHRTYLMQEYVKKKQRKKNLFNSQANYF